MGTRSKSKAAAGLLSALLLLALAVGLLAGLRPLYARAQEQGVLFYYYDPFVENIQTANHTLYWRAREQWEGKEFEPSELLLSDANAAVYAAREAGEDFVLGYTGAAGDESGGTNASYGGLEHRASTALQIPARCLPSVHDKSRTEDYVQFLGLVAHEYFHTWNVKRIKPA